MTTTQIPPVVSTRIDISDQPMTRTEQKLTSVGPARIVETSPSMETSKRYWEVYCPTCTTHECTLDQVDPRLTQRRDQHNREHSERPLPYPGDPESLRIQGLERKLTEQAATIEAVKRVLALTGDIGPEARRILSSTI